MKKFLFLILIFSVCRVGAQVPEPETLWLKGIGGGGGDQVSKFVTATHDGGFIIGLGINGVSGSGNVDSFCALSGSRSIYVKYNADATVQEWSKCFLIDGDTTLAFLFPTNDNGFVLGGMFTA